MQLKLRHIILYLLACILLIWSRLSAGSLLALVVFMQMAILLNGIKLSKSSQLCSLKVFLISTPLMFFWGGIHSFVVIYFSEGQYLFALMAGIIDIFLSFMISLQLVFWYQFMEKNEYAAIASLQDAFNNIKTKRMEYLRITAMIFLFSLIPWLDVDWKLVFAVTATHFVLNQKRLKQAFSQI